jgi:hypothetical protein
MSQICESQSFTVTFEVLTGVIMLVLVLGTAPCGVIGRYSTNVSEEQTASIFTVDGGDGMLVGIGGVCCHVNKALRATVFDCLGTSEVVQVWGCMLHQILNELTHLVLV